MPTYDYDCAACGPFEMKRPMSEAAAPAACPECFAPAPRVIGAPQLNLMSTTNRYAETRNEKSAHEPDVVHTLGPRGDPPQHARLEHHKQARGHAHRPWMIGH